jgi:hypothetical protein
MKREREDKVELYSVAVVEEIRMQLFGKKKKNSEIT